MNPTSTQSETPLRKLMIPLLVCVLAGSIALAWTAVRHRRNANLQQGAEIIQSLNAQGLDEYFPNQTELPRHALTVLSRHARKRVGNQMVLTPAHGWRYFVVMQRDDGVYEGLEAVIDQAATDGRSLAGWFEVWTWDPNTRSGDYRIELFGLTTENLVFTPIGTADLSPDRISLDHDGQESTEAVNRPTTPSFMPPSHILPALLKISHDQVRVGRFQMLRSEPDPAGRYKTDVTDVCLATTDPRTAPIELQDAQWATQLRAPGTDLPESTFYFARSGQLIGIHHSHTGPTDIIEVQQKHMIEKLKSQQQDAFHAYEKKVSSMNEARRELLLEELKRQQNKDLLSLRRAIFPPEAVLAMFATIIEREGWNEKLGWSEPPVVEVSPDEPVEEDSDDAPSEE
jgi:hypothetical protein